MALLIRFDDVLWESLLVVIRHIKRATGSEPNQEELAQALGSYFIVNEVGNQLKFLKKGKSKAGGPPENELWNSRWNFNLIGGPPLNNLARAGLFIGPVGEAIDQIRTYASRAVGLDVSDGEVASSLRSSFILSEIVNQINWIRKDGKASNTAGLKLSDTPPSGK